MGLTICLQGSDGDNIRELETELICSGDDLYENNFKVLKYVDLYGDTTFNNLQILDLEADLRRLAGIVPEQQTLISQIIELGDYVRNNVHTYVKFYGD